MQRGKRPELVWGLGLQDDVAQLASQSLGPAYQLRNWPLDGLPSKRDMGKASPLVAFIPHSVWNALPPSTRKSLRDWELTQRVLLLDSRTDGPDVEDILTQGFLTALKSPADANKFRDAVFRAKEVRGLYEDIFNMTREIMLERELLARKTDQILFMNAVLARASQSLEPGVILGNAALDLNLLFPVAAVHGVFWQLDANGVLEGEVFLGPGLDLQARQAWVEYLLESARKHAGSPLAGYTAERLPGAPGPDAATLPTADRVIPLPLRLAGSTFGCLVIAKAGDRPLGKDQVQSLNAAVNHLSLALRNAQAFREVKAKADHDGLTRIHNRQSFDDRLADELKRHQRYRHPLSLLLLDLDHFKSINDTLGHQAGDLVLKDVGAMLEECCRDTDFPARYGGEEFVCILPQTSEDQAWVLAERLRRRIGHKTFQFAEKSFQVTTSIGVATLTPGALDKREDLIRLADQALYQAKSSGRNMVCTSNLEESPSRPDAAGKLLAHPA